KGSIIQNLLMLSWPMMISQFLNMIGPTIDMIWVGKLGTAPIAGVGVGGMVVMSMMAAMMGLGVGTRAIVARFVGAGDAEGAIHAARQAIFIGICFGAFLMTIGLNFSEQILILLGVERDVVIEGTVYMRIMFVGGAVMTIRMLTEGIMQASGDTVIPMRISILFRAFHTALCPFLVFGIWIFPRLEVEGAAFANVISHALGLAFSIWILFTGRTRLKLALSNFSLDKNIMWRIIKISIPAMIMGMQRGLLHLVIMTFMIHFGTLAIAAHVLGQRLDMMVVTMIMGLGMGAGVLAGQNLGAGQPDRAERTGWLALGIALTILVLASISMLLWAEYIIRVFNSEPDLVDLASSFLRIAAIGYMVFSFIGILLNFLSGVGDTVPAMVIEIGHMWVVMIPLAYLLPKFTNMGVYGIRWAMVIGVFVGAAAQLIYFVKGRWKLKRV
ncbi:MAG: MATE family efflux transporter, partial [Deltaproteobacteria bacterium]|nr:MATE family efflux transporter [Deltaproteobacteria bacterium]